METNNNAPQAAASQKKYLNQAGLAYFYARLKEVFVKGVVASDDSVVVTGNNGVGVQISSESGNALQLKTTGNKGLYVAPPEAADTYSVVRNTSQDYAAVYQLQRIPGGTGTPVDVGVPINIPKDMVVESGTVETHADHGEWGPAGTYLHLVLANAESDDIYINVGDLIEYVTPGSRPGDMVVISIDAQHRVTATITDGTVTKAKLTSSVQASLNAADSAVQSVAEGSANGTIAVDGTNVSVHGLGSAAYTAATAYDAAGAAKAVLGSASDTAATMTVYGVKQYASDAIEAVAEGIQDALDEKVDIADIGVANGVASLGNDGKIPASQMPAFTTYTLSQSAQDGHIITLTGSDGSTQTLTIPDNDTTYAAITNAEIDALF